MILFLLGLVVGAVAAWIASDKYTHAKIASECIRLGGFYVGMRTFHCVEVENIDVTDTSTPEAIQIEVERQKRKGEP
jgi:hypothetical protein